MNIVVFGGVSSPTTAIRSPYILLLFLSSGLLSVLSDSLSDHVSASCDVAVPLHTKYFVPFYESPRSSMGCSARPPLGSSAVHVVKLNNSLDLVKEDIILLTVTDHGEYSRDEGMVLILLSSYPVQWRISLISDDVHLLNNKHTVILSANSRIVENNFRIHHLQQVHDPSSTLTSQTIEDYVVRLWGRITTFTRIGVVHRIRIALPAPEQLPEFCNLNSSSSNPGVDVFYIEKKDATGCYHKEMAGTSAFDVYIIDLESASDSSLHSSNASVYLSMNPDVSLTGGEALNRDLFLFLKSSQPVRWLLQSTDLVGNLTVIFNGDDVENFSLASSQRLKIIKKSLSEPLNSYKTYLPADVGSSSLVFYAKVDLANVLTLVIAPRAKRGLASIYEGHDDVLPSEPGRHSSKSHLLYGSDRSIIIPERGGKGRDINISKEYEDLEAHLRHSMTKDCNQKETSVIFPRSVIDKFNVSKLTLNDPSCKGVLNGSVAILKSIGTSCGSLNYFSGKHPMLKNNVKVFVEGNSKAVLRIPFSCRFRNGFPGFPSSSSSGDKLDLGDDSAIPDDDYLEEVYYDESDDYGDEEMYELHVSRVVTANHKGEGHFESLAKQFGQTAHLTIGDTIKVQTSFETRALLNLALERCWLADHSSADSELLLKEELWLIWEGCPAHENITAFSTSGGRNPSFAFKISKEIAKMKKLYIFCVLGLCSPLATNNGNLKKCLDPTVSCSDTDTLHIGPTAQQLSRRGPFYITGKEDNPEALLHIESEEEEEGEQEFLTTTELNHQIWSSSIRDKKLNGDLNNDSEKDTSNSGLRSSHVIMVGVPTELAVVISIASFVIGASLTGILCCLHHKKMIPKEGSRRSIHELRHINVRNDVNEQNGELQSMIPSSQPLGTVQA